MALPTMNPTLMLMREMDDTELFTDIRVRVTSIRSTSVVMNLKAERQRIVGAGDKPMKTTITFFAAWLLVASALTPLIDVPAGAAELPTVDDLLDALEAEASEEHAHVH